MEKKGRGVLTSNIRTICLMEAYFNLNKNILERDLAQCVEISGNVPKTNLASGREKIYYERCQQTTALQRDPLTT